MSGGLRGARTTAARREVRSHMHVQRAHMHVRSVLLQANQMLVTKLHVASHDEHDNLSQTAKAESQ